MLIPGDTAGTTPEQPPPSAAATAEPAASSAGSGAVVEPLPVGRVEKPLNRMALMVSSDKERKKQLVLEKLNSDPNLEHSLQQAKGICHRWKNRKETGRGCKAHNCGMLHAEDFSQARSANNRANMPFLQLGRAGLLEMVPPLLEGLRQWWSGVVESLPRPEHRIFPFQSPIDVENVDLGNGERQLVAVVHFLERRVDDIVLSESKRSYSGQFSYSGSEIKDFPASGLFVHAGKVSNFGDVVLHGLQTGSEGRVKGVYSFPDTFSYKTAAYDGGITYYFKSIGAVVNADNPGNKKAFEKNPVVPPGVIAVMNTSADNIRQWVHHPDNIVITKCHVDLTTFQQWIRRALTEQGVFLPNARETAEGVKPSQFASYTEDMHQALSQLCELSRPPPMLDFSDFYDVDAPHGHLPWWRPDGSVEEPLDPTTAEGSDKLQTLYGFGYSQLHKKGFGRDAKEYHSHPEIVSMKAPGVPQSAKLAFDGAPRAGTKRAFQDPRPDIKFVLEGSSRSEAPAEDVSDDDEDVEMSASRPEIKFVREGSSRSEAPAPSMSAASSGTPSIADGIFGLLERRKKSKGVGDSDL